MTRRGEITTAVVILIAAGTLFLGTMLPKLNPLKYLSKSTATQTEKSHKKIELKNPQVTPSGEVVYGYQKYDIKDNNVFTPKLTMWERITGFISSLSIWTIAFLVISVLFFGGAPIVWAVGKYKTLRQTLKNTVSAIKEADEETYKKLKPVLNAKHDVKDKRVIDDIKKELH